MGEKEYYIECHTRTTRSIDRKNRGNPSTNNKVKIEYLDLSYVVHTVDVVNLFIYLFLPPALNPNCIVLYLQPVLKPESYDGARVLEASGRPLLVKGRS